MPILAGTGLDDRVVPRREIREVQSAIVALVADVCQCLGLGRSPEGEAGSADALTVFVIDEDDQGARIRGNREINSADFTRLDVNILDAGIH
ncbi:MAG TPA: hypothetical protein VHH53_14195 [Pseudonocardiaceae bacterium]|nr:hypothetical protein [Pseudonocardiaceae bacterium]